MIAIFNPQGLQLISGADDPAGALEEFDKDVGIDPNGEGLESIAKHYTFFEVTPEQAEQMNKEVDEIGFEKCGPRGREVSYYGRYL